MLLEVMEEALRVRELAMVGMALQQSWVVRAEELMGYLVLEAAVGRVLDLEVGAVLLQRELYSLQMEEAPQSVLLPVSPHRSRASLAVVGEAEGLDL